MYREKFGYKKCFIKYNLSALRQEKNWVAFPVSDSWMGLSNNQQECDFMGDLTSFSYIMVLATQFLMEFVDEVHLLHLESVRILSD